MRSSSRIFLGLVLLASSTVTFSEEFSLDGLEGERVHSIPDGGLVLLDQDLASGRVVDIQVEQSAFDIALSWQGPAGEVLWEVDGWTGPEGPERLFAVTEDSGRYRLLLLESSPAMVNGRAIISSASIAPATARDIAVSQAEQLFWSGVTTRRRSEPEDVEDLLKAEDLLKRAQERFEILGDIGRQADCLYQRALAAKDLSSPESSLSRREAGDYRFRAIRWFQLARNLYEELEDPFQEAAAWEGIGEIEEGRDRPERAIKAYQRAIPLRQAAGDHYSLAVAYQRLGVLHKNNGDLGAAAEAYLDAIGVLDKAPVDDDVLHALANSWDSRARVLLGLRELSGASTALEEAIVAWQAMHSTPEGELMRGHALGIVIYALKGDFETAERHRAEAESLARSPYQAALVAHTSSILAYQRGDFGLAFELANAARNSFESPWEQALAQQTLASIRQAQGDSEGALADFRQSANIFESAGDYAQRLVPQIGEAESLVQLGREDEAIQVLEPILTEVEGQRREIEDTLVQSSFLAARQRPFELAAQIQMERGLRNPRSGLREKAFDLVERSRGRILGDLIVAAEVETEARGEDEEDEERWDLERRLTEGLQGSNRPAAQENHAAEIRVALEHLSILRKHRLERSPSFQATGLREPITLTELVAELPDDLIVLMYELGEETSYGWAVNDEGVCAASRLPPRAGIEANARALADSLLAPAQETDRIEREANAGALSKSLLSPFSGCLEEGSRLLLLLEGELERVPFGYLPLPSGSGRVLDQHAVTRVQSVSAWLALRQRAKERSGTSEVLLIGDPEFSDQTERLPGTRREVAAILPFLPAGHRHIVAIGSNSRPEVLATEAAGRADIWHFATHIEVDTAEPELSRIRLAGEDLYAWQLHRLKMKPNLVVLSGCEGLLGRQLAGEGFVGLTHTFLLAGATQVIAGLWKVDDGASAVLMSKFYRHLAGGLLPEEALRRAQLEMASDEGYLSEPYFWASFVVTGSSPN